MTGIANAILSIVTFFPSWVQTLIVVSVLFLAALFVWRLIK